MSDTPKPPEDYNDILVRMFTQSAKDHIKWLKRGIIGLSIFCMCLGVLGVVAIVKSIFL